MGGARLPDLTAPGCLLRGGRGEGRQRRRGRALGAGGSFPGRCGAARLRSGSAAPPCPSHGDSPPRQPRLRPCASPPPSAGRSGQRRGELRRPPDASRRRGRRGCPGDAAEAAAKRRVRARPLHPPPPGSAVRVGSPAAGQTGGAVAAVGFAAWREAAGPRAKSRGSAGAAGPPPLPARHGPACPRAASSILGRGDELVPRSSSRPAGQAAASVADTPHAAGLGLAPRYNPLASELLPPPPVPEQPSPTHRRRGRSQPELPAPRAALRRALPPSGGCAARTALRLWARPGGAGRAAGTAPRRCGWGAEEKRAAGTWAGAGRPR